MRPLSYQLWQANRPITYGGGPEGGYVCFFREREPGWYSWARGWGAEPTYTLIRGGRMAFRWEGGSQSIGKMLLSWDQWEWDDDNDVAVMILDDHAVQEERFL